MSNVTTMPVPMRSKEIDLNASQLALIKRTLAADCNDDEFNLFIEVARRIKADPFRRHVYALVFSKNDPKKRRMSIVTGIDFYRTMAARNRDYRPDDQEAEFKTQDSLKSERNPLGIIKCTVRAHKLGPDNIWYPVVGEAYWDEFVPLDEEGEDGFDWVETGETWADSGRPKMKKVPKGNVVQKAKGKWATMPRVMIMKCAEAQALRKGWPEDLSGTYVDEELDRAKHEDLTAAQIVEQEQIETRLLRTQTGNTLMVMWTPGEPLEAVPLGQFADRCIEYLHDASDPRSVEAWQDTNRAPLNEFWARSKSDALAVKKYAAQRIDELKKVKVDG